MSLIEDNEITMNGYTRTDNSLLFPLLKLDKLFNTG